MAFVRIAGDFMSAARDVLLLSRSLGMEFPLGWAYESGKKKNAFAARVTCISGCPAIDEGCSELQEMDCSNMRPKRSC